MSDHETRRAASTQGARLAYSIRETAERTTLGESTVRRLVASGKIPSARVGGRRLVPADALQELVWTGKGRPPGGHYTERTAEEELQNVLADARRGTLPDSTAKRSGTTFADASAEWLRWVTDERKRKPSTVADYRGVVSFALDPEFGTLPLEEVTTELIDGYRARLVKEGAISDRTINKRLVVLHGILRRAMRVYGLRENAAALVERQVLQDSGDFSVLSPAEVEAVARAAKTEQDAAFYRVASFTGLRLGELRALRWMDVDFAHRVVHVKELHARGDRDA